MRIYRLTFAIDKNSDITREARHFPHSLNSLELSVRKEPVAVREMTYPLRIKQSRNNARGGNQSNGESVVVIIIDRPQDDGCDLEDVEWVQYLSNMGVSLRKRC